jgi:hypothetical protein
MEKVSQIKELWDGLFWNNFVETVFCKEEFKNLISIHGASNSNEKWYKQENYKILWNPNMYKSIIW